MWVPGLLEEAELLWTWKGAETHSTSQEDLKLQDELLLAIPETAGISDYCQ